VFFMVIHVYQERLHTTNLTIERYWVELLVGQVRLVGLSGM